MTELDLRADIEATRAALTATLDELSTRIGDAAHHGKQLAIKVGSGILTAIAVLYVLKRARR